MPTLPPVVIPLRSFDAGKSRLSDVFDVATRQALIEAMLADVLAALDGAGFTDVTIAACGAHAADLAGQFQVPFLADDDNAGGLNAALSAACDRTANRATQVMIVAADLPCVQADDFLAVTACDTPVVVCPTHDDGTAVMRLSLPGRFSLAYGPQSALKHHDAAADAGLAVTVLHRDGFTWDLDTPKDLARLIGDDAQAATLGVNTRRVLMSQDVQGAAKISPSGRTG